MGGSIVDRAELGKGSWSIYLGVDGEGLLVRR
jgi:hypothetical protein